jgi:hypothetical protein
VEESTLQGWRYDHEKVVSYDHLSNLEWISSVYCKTVRMGKDFKMLHGPRSKCLQVSNISL